MKLARNKLLKSLFLFAAILFVSFATGGELLHEQIHWHESQASHDQCLIHILQNQVFLAFAILLFSASLSYKGLFVEAYKHYILQPPCFLPAPRAPPAV